MSDRAADTQTTTEQTSTNFGDFRKVYDLSFTFEDNYFSSECPSSEVLDGIRLRTINWFESLERFQLPRTLGLNEETSITQRDESAPESSP